MHRPSRSLFWIGGVLLLPFLLVAWSIYRLEQVKGELQSLTGEPRAQVLSGDDGSEGRARLETQLRRALQQGVVAFGLLAITVTAFLVLYRRDVARRQQLERAARRNEERYRHLVEHSQGLICTHDMDGILMSVNPAAARASGYTAEEMVGRKLSDFLVPKMRPLFDIYLQQMRQEGESSGVLRGQTKDGRELIWAYRNVRRDEEGKPPYVLGHAVDITERVEAEQALKKERNFIAAVVDTAGSPVVVLDTQGRIVRFNGACERLTGYSFEEVKGRPVWDLLLAPEEAKSFQVLFEKLKRGESPIEYENDWLSRSGARRRIAWSNTALVDESQRPEYVICTGIDVTERRAAEQALRESHRLFLSVVEGTPDAIFVKDRSGRYLMVNSAFTQFLNKTREEIIGKSDLELYSLETAREFVEQDRQVLANGETQTFEGIAAGPVQTQMYLVTKSVYRDDEGRVAGLIGISHDITERRQAEQQRAQFIREQQARREAEAANRLKDEFLATVSHELRTPLTGILGWATILSSRELDSSAAKRAIKTIVRNAKAQARLVDDLLDASRIVTGKLSLELRSVELVPVIEAAIQAIRPEADAKRVRLDCSLDPATGAVSGDAARLEQVVWNLLANAVKFTPPDGCVTVEVRRVRSKARITVSDTGSGIRPEFLPFAFERFRQDSRSRAQGRGGLGLGLAIVRDLVERHGGTIRVQSRGEDQGSTFEVELPLLQTNEERSAAPGGQVVILPSRSPTLSGVRVLVVEDQPDARELLETILAEAGAEVSAASSASEAIETLQQRKPDVLVSDIQMDDEDGYSLIRQVRALGAEKGGQVPAAAVTAYARSEDRAQALRAGFQAHLAKPIEVTELLSVVATLAQSGRLANKPG